MGSSTTRNTVVTSVVYIAGSIVGIVVVPILLNGLGSAVFGLYALIGSVTAYTGLMSLGMGRGFTRLVAARHAVDDSRGIAEVFITGTLVFVCIGLVTSLLAFLLAGPVVAALNIPAPMAQSAQTLLVALMIAYAISSATIVPYSCLTGVDHSDIAKYVELGSIIAGAMGSVLVVRLGFGVAGLGINALAVSIATLIAAAFATYRLRLLRHASPPYCSRRLLKEMWDYGARLQLAWFAAQVNRSVDRIYLGAFRTLPEVASYDIGDRAAASLATAAAPLTGPLLPTMTRHIVAGDFDQAHTAYQESTAVFATLASVIVAFSALLSPYLILAWTGEANTISAACLSILVTGYGVSVALTAADVVARSLPIPTLAGRVAIAYAMINLVASLGAVYFYGAVGGAAASASSAIVIAFVYAWLVERRILKLSGRVAMGVLLPVAGLSVFAATGARLLMDAVYPYVASSRVAQSVAVLSIGAVGGLLSLLGGVYLPTFPARLRQAVALRLRPRSPSSHSR